MYKPGLKSGVALWAMLALSVSATAQADEVQALLASEPAAVSKAPAGQVKTRALAPASPASSDTVCCYEDDMSALKDLPEDIRRTAKPGDCFARLLTAPKVETFAERAMVEPARTQTREVPAVTRIVEREVTVKPAQRMSRVIPAVTREVVETEVVREETYREEVIPATYEMVRERVMVEPEREVWVRTSGVRTGAALVTPVSHEPVRYRADGTLAWPGKNATIMVQSSHGATEYLHKGSGQDVYCLQIIPARFEVVERRVEVRPQEVRRIVVPAVTRQVTKTVVVTPERVEHYTVPAVVEKRKITEVVKPAFTETYEVPAVYKDVVTERVIEAPKAVWRPVLCDKNATPETVMKIQRALKARGYNPGPADGRLGSQTLSAMQKFQADNGLPQGQISIESVEALGVDL